MRGELCVHGSSRWRRRWRQLRRTDRGSSPCVRRHTRRSHWHPRPRPWSRPLSRHSRWPHRRRCSRCHRSRRRRHWPNRQHRPRPRRRHRLRDSRLRASRRLRAPLPCRHICTYSWRLPRPRSPRNMSMATSTPQNHIVPSARSTSTATTRGGWLLLEYVLKQPAANSQRML